VIYANDNRGQWRSDFVKLVQASVAAGGDAAEITRLLAPHEDDYFVLKPKQSAFFGTPLELLLQHLHAQRVIITGVSSDQCVLTTAVEAHMRDLEVSFHAIASPRKGGTGTTPCCGSSPNPTSCPPPPARG
jgi:nicotinamidase-related amidase